MLPMRDVRTNERTNEQGKIELLSFWMLDAEFHKNTHISYAAETEKPTESLLH